MTILIKNGYCVDGEIEGYFDIYIDGNLIKEVGNIERNADLTIDAKNCLVMPAFCNAHTHLAMSLFRGMADDLELMEWLTKYIFPAEARYVNPDMVYKCSKLSMLELIRSGSGCFVDMYFYEEEVAKAALEIGIRGVLGEGIVDFETPSCKNPKEALGKTESLKGEFESSGLLKVSYAPHSTYTVSKDTLKMVKSKAEGSLVQIHVNESKKEVELVKSQHGKGAVWVLDEIGLLNNKTFMAHCVYTDSADMELIAERGARVVNVPESNLKLASGIAPIDSMVKKGIPVYLGTDGSASNNNLDMIEEMRVASLVQKVRFDEKALPAKEVFKLATNFEGLFNSGKLKKGKLADIVIVELSGLEAVPIYNPYSFLVYAANSRDVRDVIIDGKPVLRNGEFVHVDEEKVKFEVRELARNIGVL